MNTVRGVVVAHGRLAAALVDAVEQIAGKGSGLVAVSNSDCDRGALEERLLAAVGSEPTIVFIDLPSGSCAVAALRRLRELPEVRVVTGVNLAMLLEFLFHADGTIDEIAQHAVETGARAVALRK